MRILISLILTITLVLPAYSQEVWQLQPWPADSNYVLGALPTGEPTWVHKSTIASTAVDSIFTASDSLYYIIGGDTINVGIVGGSSQDSTVIIGDYGVTAVETSPNTWTLKADTSEVVTPFDINGMVKGTGSANKVAYWENSNTLKHDDSFTYNEMDNTLELETTSQKGISIHNTANSDSYSLIRFRSGTSGEYRRYMEWMSPLGTRTNLMGFNAQNSFIVYDNVNSYHPIFAGSASTKINSFGATSVEINREENATGSGGLIVYDGAAATTNKYGEITALGVNSWGGRYNRAYNAANNKFIGLLAATPYGYVMAEEDMFINTNSDDIWFGNSFVLKSRMNFANSRLGLWNISPSYSLDVTGDGRFTSRLGVNSSSVTNNHSLDVRGDAGFYNAATGGTLADVLFIGSSAYPTTYRNKIQSSISGTANQNKINFALSTGVSTHTDVMMLRGDGRVSIAHVDPTRTLDVNGEVRIRDLTTTTPTRLVSADSDGVISSLGLSGLSITGGNLTVTATTRDSTIVTGGTGISVVESPLNTFTVTNTGDLSNTNEGSLTVDSGTGSTAIINSNTTSSTGVIIAAGDGIGITENVGTNTITISNTTFYPYTDLSISGTSSPLTLENSDGTDVTFTAGTNVSLVGTASNITINATDTNSGGTVTSVAATAGTGISITGSPITTSGTLNITNTAPDQVVSLTPSGIVSISGAYPNFTIGATEVGDISAVTVSAPITGGGTSGSVNIGIDTTSSTGVATQYDLSQINQLQTISTSGSAGNITLSDGGGTLNLNVNDADSDPTNELQTISKVGSTVTLSNGGGSFTDAVNDADADPANEYNTAVTSTYVGNLPAISITDGGGTRTGVVQVFSPTTAFHGSVPGANGLTTSFLRGDGQWVMPTLSEVDGSVTNEGYIGVNAGTSTSSVIRGYNSIGNATGTGVTINASGNIFISETTSQNGGQITLTGDYGAFGFGVVGNTTTIATNGTGLARIQAGTGITATNSGGTVTISSTAGATNLNFEPKSGTDVLLNSSTGADVNFRDGTNIVLTRDASNIMSINTKVAYGQLYNSSLINDATLDGTYRLVDFALNEFQSPISANASLDRITVASAGTYEISYDLTYTLPSQVRDVIFRVYKNTASIGYKGESISTHPSSTQALFTTVSKTFIATLAANDYISLQMYSAGSSTTIDINSPILTVKRL